MSRKVLILKVESGVVPFSCSIDIATEPAIRGPTEWEDEDRRAADRLARSVLVAAEGIEVCEEGGLNNQRAYRVIQKDGAWVRVK